MEKDRGIIITNVDKKKKCDIPHVVKSFICQCEQNRVKSNFQDFCGKCGETLL
jgi:hypothetical protein